MSNVLDENLYTREHEWVRIEGNKAEVGITDHAQKALGDIVFVDLHDIDDEIDGFLIERNNNFIDKFIDKIISLKNNKRIYLKIKNNALIKVKNKYDVNNTLQNYHHYL